MTLSEMLLPEFDQEMANTRKVLERVPAEKFHWKPDEKSGAMGWLASHVSTLPWFATASINSESFDFAPNGMPTRRTEIPESNEKLLAQLDQTAAEARAAIAGASDEHLAKDWSLLANGQVLFTLPRYKVIRTFMMNHMIHHRAQLTMYMRLNKIPVPGLYGPSADEPFK
jgi:uncharacterized damage-inducible protein DinB